LKGYFYTNCSLRGNKIYLRGYANGKRIKEDIKYKPYLFETGLGDYRTIHGEPLVKKQFDSIKDAKEYVDETEKVVNVKLYGLNNYIYCFLNDEFPGQIDFDPSLISIVSLDIEVSARNGMPDVEKADEEITAITLTREGKTITFGSKVYRGKHPYVFCKNEKGLLKAFLDLWDDDDFWSPDVVTGWSVDLFDIPYLINRTRKILDAKAVAKFSPLGYVEEREMVRGKSVANSSKNFGDRTDKVYELAGITVLDYLQLYKKFSAHASESYRLDYIAQVELDKGKHDYSDVGTLDDLYDKDFDRYIDYNVQDAVLVEELERKKRYLQIVFSIAYKAKINFIDTMTTSRPWDAIIHSFLLQRGIAIPQRKEPDKDVAFIGAYVKEPLIGLHEWVVSFDFDALYPNIISQHNISPETFIRKEDGINIASILKNMRPLASDNVAIPVTVTANGCMFRKDKRGFIPEIVDDFIAERIKAKSEMLRLKKDDPDNPKIEGLDNYQQALKILTNGLYGSLGQKYFRWFDLNLAEAVTTTAQVATRFIEIKCNLYLNKILKTKGVDYVVASDTDSVYLTLGALVKTCGLKGKPTGDVLQFLYEVCDKELQPYIERCCLELCVVFNVYKPRLKMKREAIADKAIWRKAKHYIMNVWDQEGVQYKVPKQTFKGIEVVRSSTPFVCRDNIRSCLKIIMNDTELDLQKFYREFYNEFLQMPFTKVAFPRSVNVFSEYYDSSTIYKKRCPIHVRGALMYNHLLDKLKLTNKYVKIREKDKIRFVYLKEPNITRGYVIAAPDELPPEFGLDEYIDYEKQFQKSFADPIKSITDVIKWKLKKEAMLTFGGKK
jgi:DNA polymerase elongation subunit (family B)